MKLKWNKTIFGVFPAICVVSATAIAFGFVLVDDPTDTTTNLTIEDNGSIITLNVGERLNLTLQQNSGSTGYTWEIIEMNESVIKLDKECMWGISNLVGGPSQATWLFSINGRGTTNLTLVYYRSWEGINNSILAFNVEINVR